MTANMTLSKKKDGLQKEGRSTCPYEITCDSKQHFQNRFQLSVYSLIMSLQSNFSACHSGHTKLTSWPFEFTLVNFETRGYYRWRLQNLNQKIHAQITSTHTGVKGRQDLKKTGIASS